MQLILAFKNIPEYGQSKCKFNDIHNIELDEQKNKITLTRKNNDHTVIFYNNNEEISLTITVTRKKTT